jgi:hypothetical protein
MTSHRSSIVLAAALAAAALAGCGDKAQTATQRKADDKPWDMAATGYQAQGFKSGDAAAWEQQLKTRAQSQNEYNRTGPR